MASNAPLQPRRLRDYTVDDLKRMLADRMITIEQLNEGYNEVMQENAALQAVVAQQKVRLDELELAGTDQAPPPVVEQTTQQDPAEQQEPTPIRGRASQRKQKQKPEPVADPAPADDV